MYLSEDSQKCMYTKGAIYSVFIENLLGKVIILSKMFEFERFTETITYYDILFVFYDFIKTRDILYIFYILTDKRINIWR